MAKINPDVKFGAIGARPVIPKVGLNPMFAPKAPPRPVRVVVDQRGNVLDPSGGFKLPNGKSVPRLTNPKATKPKPATKPTKPTKPTSTTRPTGTPTRPPAARTGAASTGSASTLPPNQVVSRGGPASISGKGGRTGTVGSTDRYSSGPSDATTTTAPAAGKSAVQQIIDQLLGSQTDSEQALKQTQLRQQMALQSFTDAIMGYLKGSPGDIKGDYQNAIDQTNQFAQTAANGLANANPNANNQATLAAINAPQSQRDALAAQNQNIFGGGGSVLYKVGGAIPGSRLAMQQGAGSAYADALPSVQALQAKQLFASLLGKQSQATSDLLGKRTDLLTKIPGMLNAQARTDLASKNYDLAVQKANNDLIFKTKNLSLSEKRVAISEWKAQNDLAFKQDAAGRAAANYYTDQNGHLVYRGYKYNNNGQLVSIGKAKTGSYPTGKAPTSTTMNKADTWAKSQFYGMVDNGSGKLVPAYTVSGFNPQDDKTWGGLPTGSRNYQAIIGKLRTVYKLSLNDAQTIADQYFQPGDFGRPAFSFQERQALSKAGISPAEIKHVQDLYNVGSFDKADATRDALLSKIPKQNPNNASAGGAVGAVQTAISFSAQQIGLPYVFGSESPGKSFDCSGLIQAAYAQAGIKIGRDTYHQIKEGRQVNLNEIQPGDLVFPSAHHVVMYVGNGQVIAAPHTGTVVQYQPLSAFGSNVMVRRIVGNA